MKTRVICMSIVLLALITSCATDELVNPSPEGTTPTPGQQVTITATLPGSGNGNDADKPGTRMGYTENIDDKVGGLLTKWTAGDALNIVPVDATDTEGTAQPFTLDAASADKSEGTFKGTAPAASSKYVIYYPANKIAKKADFLDFSYAGQVQEGNGNPDHLTDYHSIKVWTEADYTDINFSDGFQSSCMKFVLTLPGDGKIVPKTITLASADGSKCFYATNHAISWEFGDIASLSMGLEGITLTSTERTITAYMMMSCRDVFLSTKGSTVTVEATNGSKYSQLIETPSTNGNYLPLEGGMMHTLTAKNMKKVALPSMIFKVKVTAADNTFNIPFPTDGTTTPAEITVDWKDGSISKIPAGTTLSAEDDFNHTYYGASAEGTEYTITITSAQTDATKQQIPVFNFYNNRTGNNNQTKLISMNTSLLNTGATDFSYCFSKCAALTTIPEALFANNPKATNFSYCFYGCMKLTTIFADLFKYNTAAENFSNCFYGCMTLKEIPEGLFANNTAATNFQSCFTTCTIAKLNAKIFSMDGNTNPETNTRFSGKKMNFSSCFLSTGSGLTDVTASIAPQLWKYASGGTTWTTMGCFQNCKANSSSWTDDMNKSNWGSPQAIAPPTQ